MTIAHLKQDNNFISDIKWKK